MEQTHSSGGTMRRPTGCSKRQPSERGKGYGQFILEQAVAEAEKQGAKSILIHAQTQAAPFYERLGFQTSGDIFMEADIPHVLMKK